MYVTNGLRGRPQQPQEDEAFVLNQPASWPKGKHIRLRRATDFPLCTIVAMLYIHTTYHGVDE